MLLSVAVLVPHTVEARIDADRIEINFRQTNIMAVLEFYSQLVGTTFLPNEKLAGPVTVISPGPVTKKEALQLLFSVLDMKGFTLVKQGGYYKVIPKKTAAQDGLSVNRFTIGGDQMYTEVIQLKFLKASDLINDFKTILSADGSVFAGSSNDFLVITDSASNIAKMKKIIQRIDNPGSLPSSKTYSLQYIEAKTLAPTLTKLYASDAAKTGNSRVQIMAMEGNNALIVLAPEMVHADIEKVISQLDSRTMQVSIKAYLVEVDLTDETKLGFEWMVEGSYQGTEMQGGLDMGNILKATGIGAIAGEGLKLALVNQDKFKLLMNYFAGDKNSRVLSAPHILALDNQKASIEVGKEIPILKMTQTSVTSQQNVIKTYDHRKFGMKLEITPTIAENKDVTLAVTQTLSNLVTDESDPDKWQSSDRSASTTVLVKHAQTLVIGGLMGVDSKLDDQGAPYLKDVPLFGPLFGTQSDKTVKTELLLFLTPYVIATPEEADEMSGLRREESPAVVEEYGLTFEL